MRRDLEEQSVFDQFSTDRLKQFARREWTSASSWFVAGAFVGVLLHVMIKDGGLSAWARTYLSGHGMSRARVFPHLHDLKAFGVIFLVIAVLLAVPFFRRAARSWIVGCVSGIPLWCGLCATTLFLQPHGITGRTLAACLGAILLFSALSFYLFLKAAVPKKLALEARADASERGYPNSDRMAHRVGDEPIRAWSEDILNRAPIVDIITNKALVAGAPVIALSGPLGIGKTSVLNLLQKHLKEKAIVVRFVTWLPGSQDVLSSYLFSDIATECEKRYVVPGLRRSARRVARALAETVPTLKGLVEFIPQVPSGTISKLLPAPLSDCRSASSCFSMSWTGWRKTKSSPS